MQLQQQTVQAVLALMPRSITLIKLWVHFESKNKLPAFVLLFMPRHLIAIPSTHSYQPISFLFLIVHSHKEMSKYFLQDNGEMRSK